MPGSARKSGWNADRTEPFDFSVHYSISAFCMTSALSYKRLILHKGFSASAIGARRGRQHSKTARAHAGLRGAERPAPAAGARWPGRCRGRPCARTSRSGGPASALVHAYCTHACSASASPNDPHALACSKAYSVIWGPNRLVTAPGNLLQGEIKNQIWVDHWNIKWTNLVVAIFFLSAHRKYLKVKSTACMIGHRSWQFESKERKKYVADTERRKY